MPYTILFKPSAVRDLRRLPRDAQKRVSVKIDSLADNPRPHGAEKLKGEEDLHRIRAGDYRVIYQVRENVLLILVLRVGHRREVYRGI